MNSFSQIFSRFAAGGLFALHAEPVTYVDPDGAELEILAIVDRSPPERVDAAGNLVTPRMTAQVHNDAATGISAAALDGYGTAKVRVAYRVGGDPQDFGVYLPDPSAGAFQDGGMLLLDLR